MKWLIASDIHGSAYWCERLMERYEKEGADRLLLLGDLLYHGPRNDLPRDYAPQRVIAMLSERAKDILSVRGNCEAEVDQMVLPFLVMADYALLDVGKQLIFATHGHVFHPGRLPSLHAGDVLLSGHTHVPDCRDEEGVILLNPGSVSIPKEGSWHGCMTLENGVFSWLDLDGTTHLSWQLGMKAADVRVVSGEGRRLLFGE